MKKEFVRLCKLQDIDFADDFMTAEDKQAWLDNVKESVGDFGYNTDNDARGNYIVREFACGEMEFADVDYYDFAGSAFETERFYKRDIVTFKNKADGMYYVLNSDDLGEF